MKLTFNQTANGTYGLEFKVSTDFNLHVERTDASQDLYVYYRGSSEGEYKFYKKYYGKVVDEDINIVDNIVPKFFKVKSASNPVLCEVTGEVEVVIGGEDKPECSSNGYTKGFLNLEVSHWEGEGDGRHPVRDVVLLVNCDNMEILKGYDSSNPSLYSINGNEIKLRYGDGYRAYYSFHSLGNVYKKTHSVDSTQESEGELELLTDASQDAFAVSDYSEFTFGDSSTMRISYF